MFTEELLVINGQTVLTLNQVAKLLNFDIGRTKLMELMRSWGILLRHNEPSQSMIKRGYMVYWMKTIQVEGKKDKKVPVTLVTVEGLAFLKKFINKKLKSIGNGSK